MPPLPVGKCYFAIRRLINKELPSVLPRTTLLFASLAFLVPVASAQKCDFSPGNLTFQSKYSGGPYQCSYFNPNAGYCGVQFSHNNVGGGPGSYCYGAGNNICSGGDAVACYTEGNIDCGTVTDTWLAADGSQLTVTNLGIGGGSCDVPKNVPRGTGAAPTPTNPQGTAAEPVSTGNGNYYYQHADLSIVDHLAGLPLVFQRSYNSLDTFNGTLGHNWTHNFNVTVATIYDKKGNPSGAVVKGGDGHGEVFTLNNGSYVGAPGVTNALTRDPKSYQYTLTQKDGINYQFTWDGLLQSIHNTNGLYISVSRDASYNIAALNPIYQGLLLSYDQNNHLSSVSDASGRSVSYSYADDDLISETDPSGNVTKYAYDSIHRLISITLPDKSVLVQNTYDSSSRVISQTNARGYTTTFAYNTPTQGQTTITDPLGNNTIHTYDSSMRITGITDALGNTTSYTYDANNDVISITDAGGHTANSTYDSLGNMLTYTDPLGNTAMFTYNSFSERLTIKTPMGNTTTLTYDGNGNLTTIQDPTGNQTGFTYDQYGEPTSVTNARNNTTSLYYYDFQVSSILDPLGNPTNFTYDAIGRLTSVTDPNQRTSTIAYDLLSRIVSLTDALGDQTQFGYNTVGYLTSVTDANKHATAYSYDPVSNLIQVTDANGHNTKYAYDKNNNRTSFTNAKGKVTKYDHDHVNRLVGVTDPLFLSTSYGLDQVGNVISLTDANGKKNAFTYDDDDRLIHASYSDGSAVKYAYDADSNRKNMVDAHGTTAYAYDVLDRPISIDFPGSVRVHYTYDPVGNRSSLTYPDKSALKFAYDADNRLSGVTDWNKRNTSYAYDPASNLTGITFPNTVTSALTYDAANRLTGITDSASSVAYRVLAYTLDNVGNRTSVTDGRAATNYSYDAVNELLSAQASAGTTSWTYDPVGNRTQQVAPSGTTSYTYDADNRMLTAGTTKFTYDENGNRLTQSGSSGKTTYTYDANNRLLSVAVPKGTSTFAYDGDGNRITQTTPSRTYAYVNDTAVGLPVVLNENGSDGNIDYAYGLGLLESSSSAFNYFYNLDGLDSVSNLTNAAGSVQETYSYDAWGNVLTATGSVGTQNKFRFTGQALDPATELYFLRARYYDPTSGRLLSKDPLPGVAGLPLTTHRYIYANNDPARFIDPSGLWGIISTLGGSLDLGAGGQSGVAGQGYIGAGVFAGPNGVNVGGFVGGGTTSNGGGAVGAAASGGLAYGFTNANCAEELRGPFNTVNETFFGLSGSLSWSDPSQGRFIFSVTVGSGLGVGGSVYQTQTPTAQTVVGNGCPSNTNNNQPDGGTPPTK